MALPTAADVHIDRPLSNIVVSYKNPDDIYIADKVFPHVPVSFQSDKYYIWDREHWFRNHVQMRAPGSEYPEGYLTLSDDSYFCDIYHLAYPINEEDVANQDEMIELEVTGAEWLADQFILNREIDFATNFLKTGIWGHDTDGQATAPTGNTQFRHWSDYANSNPITDMITWREIIQKKTAKKPNCLVMPVEIYNRMVEHPDILDKYKYTSTAILGMDQLKAALGVEKILVPETIVNTAAATTGSTTFTGAYLYGDNMLYYYAPPSPGRRIASAAYTFIWSDVGGTGLATPVRRYNDEARSRMVLQGRQAFSHKVVGSDLAVYIADVLA